MAATLPMDLIAQDVLPRLSTKFIMRFKCVSKFFQTVISSPRFVKLLLRPYNLLCSPFNGQIFLTYENETWCSSRDLYTFDLNSGEPLNDELKRTRQLRLPYNADLCYASCFGYQYEYETSVVGSCNDILCVVKHWADTHLCVALVNPSTGMFKEACHWRTGSSWSIGFGYDDHIDDYKIVMSAHDWESVEVYSLKTDSWRKIDSMIPIKKRITNAQTGFLIENHLLHWLLNTFEGPIIRRFNLRTQQWESNVSLPDFIENKRSSAGIPLPWCYLGVVYRQYLCLFVKNGYGNPCDAWIMMEYGVKESWVKSFNFVSSWLEPIAHAIDGEVVLVDEESGSFLNGTSLI